MQSTSSRIWTRVAVSISYDDNQYTSGTSIYKVLLGFDIFLKHLFKNLAAMHKFDYMQKSGHWKLVSKVFWATIF